jgi:hypothetical protein
MLPIGYFTVLGSLSQWNSQTPNINRLQLLYLVLLLLSVIPSNGSTNKVMSLQMRNLQNPIWNLKSLTSKMPLCSQWSRNTIHFVVWRNLPMLNLGSNMSYYLKKYIQEISAATLENGKLDQEVIDRLRNPKENCSTDSSSSTRWPPDGNIWDLDGREMIRVSDNPIISNFYKPLYADPRISV